MKNGMWLAGATACMLTAAPAAMAAVVHANAPVAVPVDAPWAMAGLVGIITLTVFRFLRAGKK